MCTLLALRLGGDGTGERTLGGAAEGVTKGATGAFRAKCRHVTTTTVLALDLRFGTLVTRVGKRSTIEARVRAHARVDGVAARVGLGIARVARLSSERTEWLRGQGFHLCLHNPQEFIKVVLEVGVVLEPKHLSDV